MVSEVVNVRVAESVACVDQVCVELRVRVGPEMDAVGLVVDSVRMSV